MTWTIELGLPGSQAKIKLDCFCFCFGKKRFPAFADKILVIYTSYYLFSSTLQAMMVTYGHCCVHLTLGGLSKSWKTTLLASDQVWSGSGLASWQLLCPTDSSPACGCIWYQEYLELRSWENFSLLFLWGEKVLKPVCVLYVKYFKTLRTKQNGLQVICDWDFL